MAVSEARFSAAGRLLRQPFAQADPPRQGTWAAKRLLLSSSSQPKRPAAGVRSAQTVGIIMNQPLVPVAFRTLKLPTMLLREIGRVIAVFAAIEHELNLIAYTVLRLTTAEGRLAVTRQNIPCLSG